MITLDKQAGVLPVSMGETWQRIFAKCILRIMGAKATNAYNDDQLCAGLKAGVDSSIHIVQALWGKMFCTNNWGFLLVDTKSEFNEIKRIGMLWTVCHL